MANGKLAEAGIFKHIWAQPASGDSGGSLGAALSGWYEHRGAQRIPEPEDSMKGSYLGTEYKREDILHFLTEQGAVFTELSEDELCAEVADILSRGMSLDGSRGEWNLALALWGRALYLVMRVIIRCRR